MKISEIFYSIQGEGLLAGVPSVFLRTSGCNLRCTWCDTPYTSWQPEGSEESIDAMLAYVLASGTRHSVITGGEPFLQPQLGDLCTALRAAGQHITIETAGTVYRDVACDLMSLSPKLANSTPHGREEGRWAAQHERLRYQPDVLRQFRQRYECQWKFVVSGEADMQEVTAMVTAIGAAPESVLLMPEGTTSEAISRNSLWIVEACKRTGYRYSPRLHVHIWGDKRGV
jgi:7-carboxy-7-deazaguanine synthase